MTQPAFAIRVVDWQRVFGRNHLPWSGQDAYSVWLSEVMLQQTQVTTVLPYYAAFKQRFPTIESLAAAPIDAVLALWAGLGYYSRARNLHRCAQRVCDCHGGQFPSDLPSLEALPGIGPSTAAAIASLALNQRAAILDGNVKRVHARHAGIAGWPGEPKVAKQLWQRAHSQLIDAVQPVAPDHHRRYTQGLMDLGATVCTAKNPHCKRCPVQVDCAAFNDGSTATIPASRPKKVVSVQARHALVLHTPSGVWLERRAATGLWGGLLSLPEADSQSALKAALLPALAARFGQLAPWSVHQLKHTFTHYQLNWTVWALSVDDTASLETAPLVNGDGARFVEWKALSIVGVPKAVLKVMAGR